jgi:hypothetical protein
LYVPLGFDETCKLDEVIQRSCVGMVYV